MRVEFLSKFNRDIDKINLQPVRRSVLQVVLNIEKAKNFSQIPNVKKLRGHKSAYRIKVKSYRIGIFVEKNLVQFARIVHRKDIYRVFP